jgi:ATP-dependent DNA helicase Rep
MYVGITRAQMSLTLTWCEKRKQGREVSEREISRFVAEMGDDLKRVGGKSGTPAPEDRAAGRAKLAQFRSMLATPK